jgi:ubiquinone/menaquinone biosynthesis C-methylase UbiE
MKEQVRVGFAAAADGYDATGTEFFGEMGQHLVAHAGIRPGAAVLDVGCGKGAVALPAARATGPDGHVMGIDLALPMLEYARNAAARQGLTNTRFEEGDAEAPPFAAGSFDVLLAGNVMQWLPEPATAVRRWRDLLAPGATLATSWGLAEDPRWVPVIAAFDAQMPKIAAGFAVTMRRPPFQSVETLESLLTHSWYHGVATATHQVTMVYNGPAQWWAASSAQAPWAVCWRHIPAEQLHTAKWEAFRLLEALRGPDGMVTRTLTFACTRGTRRDTPEMLP